MLTLKQLQRVATQAIFQDSYSNGYAVYDCQSFASLSDLQEYIERTEGSVQLFLTRKQHDAMIDSNQTALQDAFACSLTKWCLAGVTFTGSSRTIACLLAAMQSAKVTPHPIGINAAALNGSN